MKQLKIANGDLVLGQGGYALVTGEEKLRQDLSLALRTPLASDQLHPGYGSTLHSFLGTPLTPDVPDRIRAEVNRVLRNYMMVRASLIQQEYASGSRPNFAAKELIASIRAIDVRTQSDRVYIRIQLTTLANSNISVTAQVA